MSHSRQNLGRQGEELAAGFLRAQGYLILRQNYRCRLGEIDIVAKDAETLVFIEVKTRTTENFGSPAAAVTAKKQKQIIKAAQYYLNEYNLADIPARFDVISINFDDHNESRIEHIADAFILVE